MSDASSGAAMVARYIVIRPAPGAPVGFVPDRLNGLWLDLNEVDRSHNAIGLETVAAVPTGRFEVQADGAVAEVWEIGP